MAGLRADCKGWLAWFMKGAVRMDDAAGEAGDGIHAGGYMGGAPFGRFAPDDLRDLVAGAPLAWIWPLAGDAHAGTMLPLMGEYDAGGALVALVGHLSRANPLLAALPADGGVGVQFTGPQGYVSPGDVGQRDWAPTWMWGHATVTGTLHLDSAATVPLVNRLVARMEAGRDKPWSGEAIAHRAAAMMARIVGFRIAVTRVTGWFKFGQDERVETLRAMLDSAADPAMLAWVERFNKDRLA